jgi:multicomponent Na+:H+ antiporter subunit D
LSWLLPLPVAIPLLASALVVACDHFAPKWVKDLIVIGAASAATVFAALALVQAERGDIVHWFGGWHSDHGVALGVSFVGEPFGAGMAVLALGVTTLALLYSWTYLRAAAQTYDALLLVLGGGMAGFALTGDVFNMFVWFELIGVAAYALSGFKVEEIGPLQGAVNFAISNTIAGYLLLIGIALLYGRTGTLNLVQLGKSLAGHPTDRLTVVAFTLLVAGLLAKAAIAPFHLWHADAHAVAPAPVCAVFSGVMIQLGLLFVARVYWTVFTPQLQMHAAAVRGLLLALGVVTMLVGALMCFLQRHLKRMLVFSTIAEAGIMLAGIALLDPRSLAGTADLVLSHGLLKAGLFLVCGLVIVQLREVDELRLHGAGRRLPFSAVFWLAGTIGMIGVPYVGVFLGHSLIEDGAVSQHVEWLQPLMMIAAGVTAGTLLRAWARIFLGWGPRDDQLLTHEPEEDPAEQRSFVPLMRATAAVALALGLVVSVVPGLERRTEEAAKRFVDRKALEAQVLHGAEPAAPPRLAHDIPPPSGASVAYGMGAAVLALAVAAFGLWRGRLPFSLRRPAWRALGPPIGVIRAAHSGIVGDYVLWIVAGTALMGAVWAFTLT